MNLCLRNLRSLLKSPSSCQVVPPDRRLVFYHIPKAAGSSLRAALKEVYTDPAKPNRKQWYIGNAHASITVGQMTGMDLPSVREVEMLMALENSKNKLVAGHFSYSCLAYQHYKENTSFMSLFRSPVSRFLSHYYYNRYKESEHCRVSCGLDEYLESQSARQSSRMYLNYFGRDENGRISDPRAQYDQAVLNLKTLDVIGIVESMDRFSNVLESHLNCRVNIQRVRSNPREKYEDEVTSSQLKKIEGMCADDLRFYDEACRLSS
jgi:hypothetical protein